MSFILQLIDWDNCSRREETAKADEMSMIFKALSHTFIFTNRTLRILHPDSHPGSNQIGQLSLGGWVFLHRGLHGGSSADH